MEDLIKSLPDACLPLPEEEVSFTWKASETGTFTSSSAIDLFRERGNEIPRFKLFVV